MKCKERWNATRIESEHYGLQVQLENIKTAHAMGIIDSVEAFEVYHEINNKITDLLQGKEENVGET